MDEIDFDTAFRALTGNPPFPWQRALYARFRAGDIPAACTLPTGLGKTSVIAVWLIALADGAAVPRRLAYVVNRRTVVDQTTDEVERYRVNLAKAGLAGRLRAMCAVDLWEADAPLGLSTIRGEHADNEEWWRDPARPAVVCGTVDLIGSALLFASYRAGRAHRPLHAGFLGQDVLLVHDEAHLEPAFQKLAERVAEEQGRDGSAAVKPFRVMELTATPRTTRGLFTLDKDTDLRDETVLRRVGAVKRLRLDHEVADDKKAAPEIARLAVDCGEGNGRVAVFVRTVADAKEIRKAIEARHKNRTALLVGPLRGREREGLVETEVFRRFRPGGGRAEEPSFLICTSAGEVGVNVSADHLVCDLTPFDSMAQRLGRVNRFGDGDARVEVVVPKAFDDKDRLRDARRMTLELLRKLPRCSDDRHDASPRALGDLDPAERAAAAAPAPPALDATDILFDAWSLTTAADLPGRPDVEPYLHGLVDEDDAETEFAWREEVGELAGLPAAAGADRAGWLTAVQEYVDEYPLARHELLRERTRSALAHLKDIAKRAGHLPAWLIDGRGRLTVRTVGELAEAEFRELVGRKVVLPPAAGGLEQGLLVGKAAHDPATAYDVADHFPGGGPARRLRFVASVTEDGEETIHRQLGRLPGTPAPGTALSTPTDLPRLPAVPLGPDESSPRLVAFVRPDLADDETRSRQLAGGREQPLDDHLRAAEHFAARYAEAVGLGPTEREAVRLAARWHDLGKRRAVWQLGIGNRDRSRPLAKSGKAGRVRGLEGYRHEFGSVLDAGTLERFGALPADGQDLVRHLIAAHHGRGRPHFPPDEAFDREWSDADATAAAGAVARTSAALARRYGRWGLAYLESLVRAADVAASDVPAAAAVVAALGDGPVEQRRPGVRFESRWAGTPDAAIAVAVDPSNPGQFFACCGLLELADRLWPGAEGWFAAGGREFRVACGGTLRELLAAAAAAELTLTDPGDIYSSPGRIVLPTGEMVIDWWADSGFAETDRNRGSRLKPWAGTMQSVGIARAMKAVLARPELHGRQLFDYACVVPDADNPRNKKEPYYFDSRRGANALPVDIGFVQDPLGVQTLAHPAVEFFCWIGLQRCRPMPESRPRVFRYHTWPRPLPVLALPAAVAGLTGAVGDGFRFENAFRTGQRKHKAFNPATPIGGLS